jgi:hypothetical protein
MYGVKHASHCAGANARSSIRHVHIVATYTSASPYSVPLLPASRIAASSSFMCSATVCIGQFVFLSRCLTVVRPLASNQLWEWSAFGMCFLHTRCVRCTVIVDACACFWMGGSGVAAMAEGAAHVWFCLARGLRLERCSAVLAARGLDEHRVRVHRDRACLRVADLLAHLRARCSGESL